MANPTMANQCGLGIQSECWLKWTREKIREEEREEGKERDGGQWWPPKGHEGLRRATEAFGAPWSSTREPRKRDRERGLGREKKDGE